MRTQINMVIKDDLERDVIRKVEEKLMNVIEECKLDLQYLQVNKIKHVLTYGKQ